MKDARYLYLDALSVLLQSSINFVFCVGGGICMESMVGSKMVRRKFLDSLSSYI